MTRYAALFVAVWGVLLADPGVAAGAQAIPATEIKALQAQLAEAKEASSSARKKLGVRRVIRAGEAVLADNATAPNRFEVLGVLYHSQQEQIRLDDSAANRQAFIETCRALQQAPDEYAALRLDADLLLSQAELARRGADQDARAEALKPLVQRYIGTEVETKVVRIALTMALEMGDASLIAYLRDVIAQEFPGDLEMISFQRDKLAGQVFGAPFVGAFKRSDGKFARFPMDAMGKTTALHFWSKDNGGIEQIKALAEGFGQLEPSYDRHGRYQFISFNLDDLPDAGERLLREAGVDWPAMHLPGGRDNPIFKTYVRHDPKLLTMTPTGYTAMVMSGATRTRPRRPWQRIFHSALARSWSRADYSYYIQAMLSGDFLVLDPTGPFDPADPPELKAVMTSEGRGPGTLARPANAVPAQTLRAIQASFIKPPMRYEASNSDVIAAYAKAEQLCRQAIADHPAAADLWIVRNRLIVALMGRWKAQGKREHFDAALEQARAAIHAGYPEGTDVIARFCLARESLRSPDADLHAVIHDFVNGADDTADTAFAPALGSLLALEVGDRKLHEHYRRQSLDRFAQHPALWNMTAFLLDRSHRYWLYHPPFTAGWTWGRRQGHFMSVGDPQDAQRAIDFELKTLDGQTIRFPEHTGGKHAIIEFRTDANKPPHLQRYGTFAESRPFDDVALYVAYLDTDTERVQESFKARQEEQKRRRRGPDPYLTTAVPGGLDNPIVQQLGIVSHGGRPNMLLIKPDGSIITFLSGLAMSAQRGNVLQNVIQAQDERAVDQALARGDLEEAKRLAFAHAPLPQPPDPEAKRQKAPEISTPHRRARAKVYRAMGDLESALQDAQAAYLSINRRAGWLAMRTEELDRIERFIAELKRELGQPTTSDGGARGTP